MKTHIRRQQHKKLKHQDIKQTHTHTHTHTKKKKKKKKNTTEVSPWNDQQDKVTGGLKPVLHGHNLTVSFSSGS